MSNLLNLEKEHQFLKTSDGTVFDVCHNYYELFLKDETDSIIASKKFSTLLCWDGKTEKTHELSSIYPKETYLEKIEIIKNTMSTILSNLIKNNFEIDEFYQKLWGAINERAFFATDLDIVCAIIYLYNTNKIPYYKLDSGLKMEDDEFREIVNANYEYLRKMIFILSVGFKQRTEVASLLLSVLDEVEDCKVKSVLLANIIGFCEKRAMQIQKKISAIKESDNK